MSKKVGNKAAETGEMSKDWKIVKLGDVLEEVDLRARDVENGEKAPVLSLTKNFGLIPQEQRFEKRVATNDVSNYKIIRRGWLVYNPYVIWEGAIYFLRNIEVGLLSPAYITWKPTTEVDWCFMDYLIRTTKMLDAFFKLSTGVVQRRRAIKKNVFSNILIHLPPIQEQRKIASILLTVDEAIMKTDEIIQKTQELKKGLMQQLMTRGIGHKKFKETELGEIPEEWKIEPLSMHCESSAYGPRFSADLYSAEGNVGTIRTTDFTAEGEIDFDTVPMAVLPEEKIKEHILKPGDLLISRSGTVGLSAVFPNREGTYIPGAYLIRFRMKENIFSQWLKYYLDSNIGSNSLKRLSEGGVQKNLKGTSILRLSLPIPSINEQEKIVTILSGIDAKIKEERQKKQLLERLKKGLMEDLLTGRVRVKVN